jgi:hypothetical protein
MLLLIKPHRLIPLTKQTLYNFKIYLDHLYDDNYSNNTPHRTTRWWSKSHAVYQQCATVYEMVKGQLDKYKYD